MDKVFKSSIFWKKFTRFLIFGLSIFVILLAFKVGANSQAGAVDYSCPAPVGSVSNMNPNGQSFAAGTRNVSLSWNAATQASSYYIIVRTTGGQIISTTDNYTGTSLPLSPSNANLTDGTSYRWSVLAKNNCESGNTIDATFSIAAAQSTTCSNSRIFCPDGSDEGGGTYVNPDPNNNCQTICPGRTAGTLTCTLTNTLGSPYNNGYQFTLNGQSASSYTGSLRYGWDLTNDGSIDRSNEGATITQAFYGGTTTRLRITDSANNFGDCYTNINYPTSSNGGNNNGVATCSINPTSYNVTTLGGSVTFNGYFSPNGSNRYATNYNWNFGDGSTSGGTNSSVPHNFSTNATVVLTINDNLGGVTSPCYSYITVNNSNNTCTTEPFTCSNGTVVYRNPALGCNFNSCPNNNNGNQCRSLSNCPTAPAGCSYSGRLISSCDQNAILTCGVLTGNNCSSSSAGSFTTVTPGNGTTITNFNSSSSSSSSSNSNNNNINIK